MQEAALQVARRIEAERDLIEAIDLAIGSWRQETRAALRSPLPAGTSPTVAIAPTPAHELVELARRATITARKGDDHRQPDEFPQSRLAILGVIYLTAASSREILVSRSHRDPRRKARAGGSVRSASAVIR